MRGRQLSKRDGTSGPTVPWSGLLASGLAASPESSRATHPVRHPPVSHPFRFMERNWPGFLGHIATTMDVIPLPAEAIFLGIGANVALLCMVAVLGFLSHGLMQQSVHHARASKVRSFALI